MELGPLKGSARRPWSITSPRRPYLEGPMASPTGGDGKHPERAFAGKIASRITRTLEVEACSDLPAATPRLASHPGSCGILGYHATLRLRAQ